MIHYGEISQLEQEVWRTELLKYTCTLEQQGRCINWTNYNAIKQIIIIQFYYQPYALI